MKPNDENGNLPLGQRPFRILIIAGSDRRQYNCPGADSKARTLMLRMADKLPQEWEIDYEDLGNAFGYKAPGHRWRDLQLKWRELKMQAGHAPPGSSPAAQEISGLNRDTGSGVKKSDGEKLRSE